MVGEGVSLVGIVVLSVVGIRTRLCGWDMDLDGFGWIWMDLDGFGWIWMLFGCGGVWLLIGIWIVVCCVCG